MAAAGGRVFDVRRHNAAIIAGVGAAAAHLREAIISECGAADIEPL